MPHFNDCVPIGQPFGLRHGGQGILTNQCSGDGNTVHVVKEAKFKMLHSELHPIAGVALPADFKCEDGALAGL